MDQKISTAEKIARNTLPEVLSIVYEAGGWASVIGLVDAFGGQRISIPMYLPDDHPLIDAGGINAAKALVLRYGGARSFDFPLGGHSLKLLIVQENTNLTLNELATLLHCTRRYAARLRKEAKNRTVRIHNAGPAAQAAQGDFMNLLLPQ